MFFIFLDELLVGDLLTAMSVLIAALSFIYGINAWKREYVGKRRIDEIESVLSKFYEAADIIRAIRNPLSFAGEGSSRERGDNETEEVSQDLDNAYVAIERYNKHHALFSELNASKYRMMAMFGNEASEPFTLINKSISDIFVASRALARLWRRQGRTHMSGKALDTHLAKLDKYESVIWWGGEDDPVDKLVQQAIDLIEKFARTKIGHYSR